MKRFLSRLIRWKMMLEIWNTKQIKSKLTRTRSIAVSCAINPRRPHLLPILSILRLQIIWILNVRDIWRIVRFYGQSWTHQVGVVRKSRGVDWGCRRIQWRNWWWPKLARTESWRIRGRCWCTLSNLWDSFA